MEWYSPWGCLGNDVPCPHFSFPFPKFTNNSRFYLNFKEIISNFVYKFSKFAGGQAPSTTLHYRFTRGAEQSERRPQNPVSL
jgi:hypothetical protein